MDPENILRNRLNSLIENGLLSYDVLIQIYGMTYEMIAGYTGIDANEIIDFVNKEQPLSVEKKYMLAVKVFSIVQAIRGM